VQSHAKPATATEAVGNPVKGVALRPESRELTGVQVVFQTPFTVDGQLDMATFDSQIDWLFTEGADGIVFAMVSEILRLSSEERDQVTIAACQAARGKGDSIISVGAESVTIAIRHAKVAADAGATALMAAPPSLFRVNNDSLLRYYLAIAEAVPLPLVVQDASGYVGAPLSINLQASLYHELGDLAYFKPEAPPIGPRVTLLRERTDNGARIFEGTGGLYLIDSFRRGAVGTMPAGDLVWALVPLWRALVEGNFDYAYRIAGPLTQIVSLQTSLDSFVAIEKRNLVRQGIFPTATMRQPTGEVIDIQMVEEVDRLVDLLRAAVASA
jgi:dihydrodipicolinate synthase/N-acetylneuraminate lyase